MGSIKLQNELHNKDIQNKIIKMRINGVFYLIGIFVVYYLGVLYIPIMANDFWKGILGTLYWLVTTFVVNVHVGNNVVLAANSVVFLLEETMLSFDNQFALNYIKKKILKCTTIFKL